MIKRNLKPLLALWIASWSLFSSCQTRGQVIGGLVIRVSFQLPQQLLDEGMPWMSFMISMLCSIMPAWTFLLKPETSWDVPIIMFLINNDDDSDTAPGGLEIPEIQGSFSKPFHQGIKLLLSCFFVQFKCAKWCAIDFSQNNHHRSWKTQRFRHWCA